MSTGQLTLYSNILQVPWVLRQGSEVSFQRKLPGKNPLINLIVEH